MLLLLNTTIMFLIRFNRRGGVVAVNFGAPLLHAEAIDICMFVQLTNVL